MKEKTNDILKFLLVASLLFLSLYFIGGGRCLGQEEKIDSKLIPVGLKATAITQDSVYTLLFGKEQPPPPPILPVEWDSITTLLDSAESEDNNGKKLGYYLYRPLAKYYWVAGDVYLIEAYEYNSNPGHKDFPQRFAPLEKIEYIQCTKE